MTAQINYLIEEDLKQIRKILEIPTVMDIVINKPCEIYAITADKGWIKYDAPELTKETILSIARQIANNATKGINEETPILSAQLPTTGERVQIVIPPAASEVSITIRKASPIIRTLEELEETGSFNAYRMRKNENHDDELMDLLKKDDLVSFLKLAVKSRKNIIVSGATGSGKTTFMKSLIMEIPLEERLITIEDVPELDLHKHDNKVHLFYARSDESAFSVDAKSALASCLRMRPSRILLAELRGDEAWEYIKSVNTGHEGSITSMHANNAFEAFEQLVAFIKDSKTGSHLDSEYIRSRLFGTIDIVIHFEDRQFKDIYFEPARKKAYLEGRGQEYRGDNQ